MVDEKLHQQTQYRIPKLEEQIEEAKDRVGSFVIECNQDDWDGYEAAPITIETIKLTALVLDTIKEWFIKNIGFLNNRSLDIWTAPAPDGHIHIEINYDEFFECDLWIKEGEKIEGNFHPQYRHQLDGTKTIAERDYRLVFSKDTLSVKCDIEYIHEFLDEAFYIHKWRFEMASNEDYCRRCGDLNLDCEEHKEKSHYPKCPTCKDNDAVAEKAGRPGKYFCARCLEDIETDYAPKISCAHEYKIQLISPNVFKQKCVHCGNIYAYPQPDLYDQFREHNTINTELLVRIADEHSKPLILDAEAKGYSIGRKEASEELRKKFDELIDKTALAGSEAINYLRSKLFDGSKGKKYCVEIDRELEEKLVGHFEFDGEPTKEQVIKIVKDKWDINYDDKYGRIIYYEV